MGHKFCRAPVELLVEELKERQGLASGANLVGWTGWVHTILEGGNSGQESAIVE